MVMKPLDGFDVAVLCSNFHGATITQHCDSRSLKDNSKCLAEFCFDEYVLMS
eukprot:m.138007 g.138007  ORF g.138007 m.138007 type:complete len:52 (+) comp17014_c0_seq4:940-1095(+)